MMKKNFLIFNLLFGLALCLPAGENHASGRNVDNFQKNSQIGTPNYTLADYAIQKNNLKDLKELLDSGVNPDNGSVDGRSLLLTAIEYNNVDALVLLFEENADPNYRPCKPAEEPNYSLSPVAQAVVSQTNLEC